MYRIVSNFKITILNKNIPLQFSEIHHGMLFTGIHQKCILPEMLNSNT